MAKILIIDDEKEIIELLTLYLEKDNFSVSGALDGESGLKLLEENDFDCVLLDIMIPNINGFNVLKAIRKTSSIPVIIISAKITGCSSL